MTFETNDGQKIFSLLLFVLFLNTFTTYVTMVSNIFPILLQSPNSINFLAHSPKLFLLNFTVQQNYKVQLCIDICIYINGKRLRKNRQKITLFQFTPKMMKLMMKSIFYFLNIRLN